jgi:hypothetical protein
MKMAFDYQKKVTAQWGTQFEEISELESDV